MTLKKHELQLALTKLQTLKQKVKDGTFNGDKDRAIIDLCDSLEVFLKEIIKRA